MGVGSYIEMYTTILGWQVYAVIWDGIISTGIVYIPFLFLVFEAMISIVPRLAGVASGETRNDGGVTGIIGELITKLIIAMVVVFFFAVPTVQLELTDVSYQPRPTATDLDPETVTPDDDPTTLRSGFQALPDNVQIPLGWNVITRIASGFTFGVAYSIPRPIDLEESISTLELSNITDPQLAREVPAFYEDCYIPARARLEEQLTTSQNAPTLAATIEENGLYDRSYLGSLTLLETPGLYAACADGNLECGGSLRARQPVEGFAFDATRDAGYTEVDIANGVPGRPLCDEWWVDIRGRILEEEEESAETTWEYLRTAFGDDVTDELVEQARVQRVLSNSAHRSNQILGTEVGEQFGYAPGGGAEIAGEGAAAVILSKVARTATGVVAIGEAGGTGIEAYSRWRKMSYLKKAVPAVIGIMLMVIPILLPFAMLWKVYSVEGIVVIAITYFAIRFLSALFEIGVLVEDSLQKSIFGDFTDIVGFVANGGLVDSAEFLVVLAFLLPAIFILIPGIFMYMAVAMGLEAGRGIGAAVSSGTTAVGATAGLKLNSFRKR